MEDMAEPDFSAQRWIEAIYANRQVNVAIAKTHDPTATELGSIVEGRSIDEQLAAEHANDPDVATKNRFLGLLSALANDENHHLGDFLALMDNQANDMPPAQETQYRQFMGLWDLAVSLAKDEQLVEELKEQY